MSLTRVELAARVAELPPHLRGQAAEIIARECPAPAQRVTLRQHLEQVDPGPHLDWWHVGAMAERTQAVLDGEIQNLLLAAPPRSYKSRIVVQGGSSCRLRNQPSSKVMTACAAHDLVMYHSRHARAMAEDAGVKLSPDSRAVELWETTAGGVYKCVTVGATRLGFGWDYGTVDDPFASWEAAQRRTVQRTTWQWYKKDWRGRRQFRPEGIPAGQVMMHQRLSSGDVVRHLCDWLEDGLEEEWHALILDGFRAAQPYALPSALHLFEDPRAVGEPLCSSQEVMHEIEGRRKNDPLLHGAVDQQRPPSSSGGGIFRASWLPIIGKGRKDLAKPLDALAAMAAAGELTGLKRQIRGHDYSGGGADAVASGGICQLAPGGRYEWVIFDPTTDHPVAAAVESVAIANARRDPPTVEQATPKETGVGAAVAASINRQLKELRYTIHPMPVGQGKVALAQPLANAAMPVCEVCVLPVVDTGERDAMAKGSVCACAEPRVRLGKVAILATPDERAQDLQDRMHDFDGDGEDDDVDAVCCAFNAAKAPGGRSAVLPQFI